MLKLMRFFRKKDLYTTKPARKPHKLTLELLEDKALMAVDITRYAIPSPIPGQSADGSSLSSAKDGQIWFVRSIDTGNVNYDQDICEMSVNGDVSVVVPSSELKSISVSKMMAGTGRTNWFLGWKNVDSSSSISIVGYISETGQVKIIELGSDIITDQITKGSDGSVWVTASKTVNGDAFSTDGSIIDIDQTGIKEQIPLIHTSDFLTFEGIAADRAGNIWLGAYFYENDTYKRASVLYRYSQDGIISQYSILPKRVISNKHDKPVYRDNTVEINSLTQGPDGNIWFTTGAYSKSLPRSIWRVTPRGHFSRKTVFPIGVNGLPDDIIAGKGKQLYFKVLDTNWDIPYPQFKIGNINTSGQLRFIRLPKPKSDWLDPNSIDPGEMQIGPDGNLWFDNWLHWIESDIPLEIIKLKLHK